MKKVILIALLCLVATPAFAFDLGGYTGPVEIKFYDYTVGRQYSYDTQTNTWLVDSSARAGLPAGGSDLVNGTNYGSSPLDTVEDSWGIIEVQSINAATGAHQLLWTSGKNGEYVNGLVYGFNDVYLNATSATSQEVGQIGGGMDLYLSPTSIYASAAYADPSTRSAIESGITTGNTKFLQLVGVNGVVAGKNWTRDESVNGLTSPFSGSGSGYFNVVEGWGSYDWLLNGNASGHAGNPTADVYAKFDFSSDPTDGSVESPEQNLYDARSSDPATGRATVIPEPASMTLLGLGLAGLARLRRKY